MKQDKYDLTPEVAQHLGGLFFKTADETSVSATLFEPTEEGWRRYIGVLRVVGTTWCDFALFSVSGHESENWNRLFFGDCTRMVPLGEVALDDAAASGHAKWDGCREVRMDVHECDDEGMALTFEATAALVRMAVETVEH